ncbi:MAG: hypothetical protein U0Q16_06835 [Bryobacteraceae bacterium]
MPAKKASVRKKAAPVEKVTRALTREVAPAPPAAGSCTEFSIVLAVLAPDNKRQISFSISRGCIDDHTPFYNLIFILRDLVDGQFQDRVNLNVTVGPADNPKAQALMDRGLKSTQLDVLKGPLTTKTKNLAPGSNEKTPAAAPAVKETANILNK